MNVIIHLVVLFIFTLVLLMLNIPKIASNSFIKQKLYIFTGIFIFEMIISGLLTIYEQRVIDAKRMVQNSLQSALIAIVAYSIYNDLIWSSNLGVAASEINRGSRQNFMIAVIITFFIAMGYLVDIVLTQNVPKVNDCLNTIYLQNCRPA